MTATDTQPVTRQQLAAVAQLLNQDPALYHAFGALWWSVKAMLAREFAGEHRLWFLRGYDEPKTRAIFERRYPDEQSRFAAALHHYGEKLAWGEQYADHSYLPGPNQESYRLNDPDMDAANAPIH